jgi:hypothetical protein
VIERKPYRLRTWVRALRSLPEGPLAAVAKSLQRGLVIQAFEGGGGHKKPLASLRQRLRTTLSGWQTTLSAAARALDAFELKQ